MAPRASRSISQEKQRSVSNTSRFVLSKNRREIFRPSWSKFMAEFNIGFSVFSAKPINGFLARIILLLNLNWETMTPKIHGR